MCGRTMRLRLGGADACRRSGLDTPSPGFPARRFSWSDNQRPPCAGDRTTRFGSAGACAGSCIWHEANYQSSAALDNDQKGGFWKGGNSFPSGHATSSFSVATVFAYEYRDHIAVPITAYALASAVSVSRLSARQHWFSDIFVGGATGFLLGRYVYKKHHDPELPAVLSKGLIAGCPISVWDTVVSRSRGVGEP